MTTGSTPAKHIKPAENATKTSDAQPSSHSRSASVLIPPIRSLATRDTLLHASRTSLRRSADNACSDSSNEGPKADVTSTISDAIAQLESILEEACRLAQTVNEVEQEASALSDHGEVRRRRTSDAITNKGMEYLANAEKQVKFRSDPSKSSGRAGLPKLSKAEIKAYIRKHANPPVQQRTSSQEKSSTSVALPTMKLNDEDLPNENYAEKVLRPEPSVQFLHPGTPRHQSSFSRMFGARSLHASVDVHLMSPENPMRTRTIDLKHVSHVDVLDKPDEFDVFDTCSHAPIARDWPIARKRFAAAVVCINTVCLGLLIGIFAGEVPAIQYRLADFHHFTILGNVFLYSGLALSTLIFWPLPVLHGRKIYTVLGLAMTFGLHIPQGIAITNFRMPDQMYWHILLLVPRALSGLTLGLVNINLQWTLLDLFGSSLQSKHLHGEIADDFDVRRHGGGMGLWLAACSWCSIGSISSGFVIGALIIENASVDWGFWTSLLLLMFVIILNVITPEVRRSAFRRTVADLMGQDGTFSRVARGEVKMHLKGTGPLWWGEEVQAGLHLSWLMIKQPGFLVLSVYAAWSYAQFTLIMMLLGALSSTTYCLRPQFVGLCALSLVFGSLLAVPFQNASLFSRSRVRPARTNSMTYDKATFWSSHLVRRGLFTILLPLSATGYALTSWGPPLPIAVPCVLSAFVAYFSNLAIAECNGLIMETFDTSDLQQGMTGRPTRKSVVESSGGRRTNFSCYPRVSAGMAITQSLSFALAAAATGVGGRVERRLGAMKASGVAAGILLVFTLLLTAVLWRWKTVQMLPSRQPSTGRLARQHTTWEPLILGTPSGNSRKLSLLECGRWTRWSEIRRRNRVNTGLTGS